MSQFIPEAKKACCPHCNGKQFVRSVKYELYQSIDEDGNIIDDDLYTWDREITEGIRCVACGENCDHLFGEEQDHNWMIEVL